jgi:BirA family biotin operon repressor/biotin-[acetyl-CoA-carboxylase] ligase
MSTPHVESPEPLDAQSVRSFLSSGARSRLSGIDVLDEIDSTNAAMQRMSPGEQHGHVILAEQQTAGRGRLHRRWFSPRACNIYMSLGWQFERKTSELAALPLAVAVAACRALARTSLRGYGIKWPNDILVDGAKLAGILVELGLGQNGRSKAVIGIGLNVAMPDSLDAGQAIDQPWTDLSRQLPPGGSAISRNLVAALLLEEQLSAAGAFDAGGFDTFRSDWRLLDLLVGREVTITQGDGITTGIARGIGQNGGLRLEVQTPQGLRKIQEFHAGDVSVRQA